MNKILAILFTLIISTSYANAYQEHKNPEKTPLPTHISKEEMAKRESAFEQRLGLTDIQKKQAKELRIKGHEQMEPIILKIRTKEQEMIMVKNSTIDAQSKNEKLEIIRGDLKSLHKQAHDLRIENMKNFEELLTEDQKKILKEMRKEGRNNYHKNHTNKFSH